MKIGITGLPSAGKTTIFNALTGSEADVSMYQGGKKEPNLSVVKVPDPRLERLSGMYRPKKTTPAQVTYIDAGGTVSSSGEQDSSSLDELLKLLRPADALITVIRNFEWAGQPPSPQDDWDNFESELILTDLITVERRVERLDKEINKGKKGDPRELEELKRAADLLNAGRALRSDRDIAESPLLRGYAFLSAKPCIAVLNSGDDMAQGVKIDVPDGVKVIEIKGNLEMEISMLDDDEADLFREDMGLPPEPAIYRLIQESYQLLGLLSFFTVGPDEVKAWTIRKDTPAPRAAGVIHSDIEKGFIRAEVISYDDLMEAGSYAEAQKAGKTRLEGRDYIVQDGDIINFRFNV
jgi:GTP-binding protein YchF